MKQQIVTKGIVLSRTDYQEADRILTVLTPNAGKLRVMAKGVRRSKSKMAGGIELFSVNDLTVLPSQRELKTLVSSRVDKVYGNIVKDINRTMLGYELLKIVNKHTEDEPEAGYFTLLEQSLAALDDLQIAAELVELWFVCQLLKINGHTPNLRTDTEGLALNVAEQYLFEFDSMSFRQQSGGPYTSAHIKLLRLGVGLEQSTALKQVKDAEKYASSSLSLVKSMLSQME